MSATACCHTLPGMAQQQATPTLVDLTDQPDQQGNGEASQAVAAPPLTVEFVRASDQIRLRLEFVDLELIDNQLVEAGPAPAIRVGFGPQHTVEAAIASGATPDADAADSRTAGDTVVVVSVDPPLAFDSATLLDLTAWDLTTSSGDPNDGTLIEAPQAIVLAPEPGSVMSDESGARTVGDVTELWTARFTPTGVEVVENRDAGDDIELRSPSAAERDDLVVLTSAVAPVEARRLWLSLHGAFLDLLGEWDDTDTTGLGTNVVRWLHRAVTGRDLDIEVTTRGYLAPFGHRAAMVTVTERSFLPDVDDEVVAALTQETYLTVTEPRVSFPTPFMPNDGRGFPFSEVTAVGSSLIPVDKHQITWTDDTGVSRDIQDDRAWHVVDTSGSDIVMSFLAVDRAGNDGISFDAPITFITHDSAFAVVNGSPPTNLAEYFTDDESINRREIALDGAAVAWADDTTGSGQTTKITERIRLTVDGLTQLEDGVTDTDLEEAAQPNIFPQVERAWVIDDALATAQGSVDAAVEVELHHRWLDHGNEADNFDLAYLRLAEPADFSVGGDGRAVVALDLVAEVFNQTTGAGPDRSDATVPWDPAEALGDTSKILGSIRLADLIPPIDFTDAIPGLDIPGLDVVLEDEVLTATFSFAPKLQTIPGFLTFDDATASVVIESKVSIDGSTPPSTVADVVVRDFALTVPPVVPAVTLYYNKVRVIAPDDGPVDVDYDLDHWELEDLLKWLQPLIDKLAAAGGSARIEITDNALDVAFGYTPPALNLGVLSIRNFEIGAAVRLPFDGTPITIDANVGRQERPVEVSLLGFEGSFYMLFGMGGTPTQLELVAISAEVSVQIFGIDVLVAEVAIDLGISGCFMIEGGDVIFGGCVSLTGVVDVLGLISVSAGIVGSLAYNATDKDLVVSGRITYSVDTVLTKPKEGSLPLGDITYSLGAPEPSSEALRIGPQSNTTPAAASFADRFAPADWLEYTGAFA